MAPARKRSKTAQEEYLCTSCFTVRVLSSFPEINPTSDCTTQLINACKSCLRQWIGSQVEDGAIAKGGVKFVECPELMSKEGVEFAVTKKLMAW